MFPVGAAMLACVVPVKGEHALQRREAVAIGEATYAATQKQW